MAIMRPRRKAKREITEERKAWLAKRRAALAKMRAASEARQKHMGEMREARVARIFAGHPKGWKPRSARSKH